MIQPAHRVSASKEYYFSSKLQEVREMSANGTPVINLGIGNPDLPPPGPVVRKLTEAAVHPDVHGYQPYRGVTALRNAFARWYAAYYHVDLNPDREVLPLIGSKEGIFYISLAFLNPGDRVLVPDVGYPAYKSVTELIGAVPLMYEISEKTGWLPDFNALEHMDLSGVKLMWVNYPNMPSGTPPTETLFKDLVRFGRKNNILVCQDNPYSFILSDQVMSILRVPGARDVAVELNSLSKAYNMAGWRIGVLAGAQEYLDKIFIVQSNVESGMFKPLQLAAVEAMRQPPEWFESMNKTYRERKEVLFRIMDFLGCRYEENSAGLFVWARVPDRSDGFAFSDKLLYGSRVFITPGGVFGDHGKQYIRASLCEDIRVLREALTRIKQNWENGNET
ncbi:MAG: aminotransferase class I/II-fold pyridoxal phosphate-dependent enzyme [Chlorobi bacterium]|nr:aminotransferase class I/II-fold pyridoxal phosphate-dependent enzyme [Chlorobiota bacterium]